MTADNILLSVIMLVISILASKYITPIMPEAKKAKSLMIDFLAFFFRYVFNLSLIIISFIYDDLNKLFVLKIVFFTSIIIINYIHDMSKKAENNVYKNLVNIFSNKEKENAS